MTDESSVKTRGDFGWKTRTENGRVLVTEVLERGAAQRGGVNPGDELVAVDEIRATDDFLRRRAVETPPGTRVRVTVLRRDRLATLGLVLGARRAGVWKIEPSADARPAAKRLARRWLGTAVSA